MIAWLVAGSAFAAPATGANPTEVDVSGLAEVRVAGLVGVDGVPWQGVARLRPTLDVGWGDRFRASATVELGLAEGRDNAAQAAAAFGAIARAAGAGLQDDGGTRRWQGAVGLDRLFADVYLKKVDLRVGRQALQWGSGQLINPTDPLPQVLFAEPWKPRAGVNAVRATVAVSERAEVQGLVAIDDDWKHPRVAARATGHLGGTDVSGVAAYRDDDRSGLIGLDVRGTYAVGFWFEGAVRLGEGGYGEGVYETFTVGVDRLWTVLQGVSVSAQYIRNGGGRVDVSLADRLGSLSGQGSPFQSPVGGRDYALVSGQVGWLRELATGCAWLQNLDDGSGFVVATATARPNNDVELAVTAQVPFRTWGDGGELSPAETRAVVPLPSGGTATLDLAGFVPEATITGQIRVRY